MYLASWLYFSKNFGWVLYVGVSYVECMKFSRFSDAAILSLTKFFVLCCRVAISFLSSLIVLKGIDVCSIHFKKLTLFS